MTFKIPWSLNFLNSLCGYEGVGREHSFVEECYLV